MDGRQLQASGKTVYDQTASRKGGKDKIAKKSECNQLLTFVVCVSRCLLALEASDTAMHSMQAQLCHTLSVTLFGGPA